MLRWRLWGFYRNLRSGSTWAHHRIRGIRFGLGFALVFALVFAVFALVFALVFAVVSAGPQAVSRAPRSTGEQLGQPGTSRDNLPRTLTLATNETVAVRNQYRERERERERASKQASERASERERT